MMFESKLNEYKEAFGDQFPTYPLMLTRTEEQAIEMIDSCIKNKKDVYAMGYLKDDPNIQH